MCPIETDEAQAQEIEYSARASSSRFTHHQICMVCDFFHPNMGGVETHIWCLSQCLIQRGHKVIVLTHAYGDRQGIRVMTNGLKVYYLPITVVTDQIIAPTMCSFFLMFRSIMVRERISVVHGHQSVSPMTHEALFFARTLGLHTCYTDHSLFGFADIASIHINKIIEATLSDVDHIICVSNTCRENLMLRARLYPSLVSTVPNAVDSTRFIPDPSRRDSSVVNIVVLSRLVYRKGIDLLAQVIPRVCSRIPNARFIIGGDGPKRLRLEEMREYHQLHDRVELLGPIAHSAVRDVLVRGHVFLNCSLTESFCIALLEAASCGLFVVSTRVGGVPEVLPPSMIQFADVNCESLVDAVVEAVVVSRRVNPSELHERVKSMYNWTYVAKRTESIYNSIAVMRKPSLLFRLIKYFSVGLTFGSLTCVIAAALHIFSRLLNYVFPLEDIEVCRDVVIKERHVLQDVK